MAQKLGRHHPTVRRLRALRRDGDLRRKEGVFLAEGLHLAQEAIEAEASIELVVTSPRLASGDDGRRFLSRLETAGVAMAEASDAVLDSIQDARSPQPVLAVVRRREPSLGDMLCEKSERPLLVVAYGLQDPGNLGNLFRSADAAGAAGLFASGDSVDLFHPRTVRASMGSVFRLPTLAIAIDPLLERLQARGITLIGTAAAQGDPYHRADLTGAVALFFGGEGAGLPQELAARLDRFVRIPLHAGVESLSVGAAAAVLLFEAARQRQRD